MWDGLQKALRLVMEFLFAPLNEEEMYLWRLEAWEVEQRMTTPNGWLEEGPPDSGHSYRRRH